MSLGVLSVCFWCKYYCPCLGLVLKRFSEVWGRGWRDPADLVTTNSLKEKPLADRFSSALALLRMHSSRRTKVWKLSFYDSETIQQLTARFCVWNLQSRMRWGVQMKEVNRLDRYTVYQGRIRTEWHWGAWAGHGCRLFHGVIRLVHFVCFLKKKLWDLGIKSAGIWKLINSDFCWL